MCTRLTFVAGNTSADSRRGGESGRCYTQYWSGQSPHRKSVAGDDGVCYLGKPSHHGCACDGARHRSGGA